MSAPSFSFSQKSSIRGTEDYYGGAVKDWNYNIPAKHSSEIFIGGTTGVIGNQSPVNFRIPTPITFNGIFRLALSRVGVIWDVPNINPYNQTFTITQGLNVGNVTIPTGIYNTSAAMAAAVQSAITGLGGAFAGFTVAINAATLRLEVTNALSFTISGVNESLKLSSGLINKSSVASGGNQVASCAVPMLIYCRHYDIISSAFTKYQKGDIHSNRTVGNIITSIYTPNTVGGDPTPSWITFEISNLKWMRYSHTADIGYIDIQVQDEFGNPLYYDPAYMQLCFELIFEVQNLPTE